MRGYYLRSPKLIAITSDAALLLVRDDGAVLELETPHPRKWSSLLQRLSNPLAGGAFQALRAELAEDEVPWDRLVEEGFILTDASEAALASVRDRVFWENQGFDFVPGPPRCEHLVVACAGSVVAGLVAPALLSLHYSRFQTELDVILTETALRFVTRDLFESYGIRTWVDPFERRGSVYVPHVHLARSADCVLVMPATASSLQRIASGACTDLLSLTTTVTRAPVVLVPVMNDAMWNHPGVQRNVQRLRSDGMFVVEPTLIFGAADVAAQGAAMFGGHGPLWGGPRSLKHALGAVLGFAARQGGSSAAEA